MASSGYLPGSEFASFIIIIIIIIIIMFFFVFLCLCFPQPLPLPPVVRVFVSASLFEAFHATHSGTPATPSPAGLRQRDTAATVGGGWHQRDGQGAGH